MKVYGVTAEQVEQAAKQVGVRVYGYCEHNDKRRPYVNFNLKTGEPTEYRVGWRGNLEWKEKYQRLTQRTKVSTAKETYGVEYNSPLPGRVCWHGFRDFLRALFALAPNAEVRTLMARYQGVAHFERTYRATQQEGGSYMGMNPMIPYEQACTCGENEHE